ncbi:MAG: response regulator transcription factor [Romboutsia sp.]|uniref:response regulator transcription factor n=1 Tax=Romboutsia sp. TaxID=1965302 RepID=UPI003F365342
MINILIAEDDLRILRLISDFLKKDNYKVYTATDGQEALDIFYKQDISLVILDIMMPIYDGWHVCREIRKKSDIPVLILTAKDSDLDELCGFDVGADEYISKPFNPMLLLARVKNLLKRFEYQNEKKEANVLIYEDISVDLDTKLLKINNENIELKPKEYDLIVLFIKNKERIFERENLLDLIWGYDYLGDPRTLDTHINRLRNKLGDKAYLLKTIRGFGYKFGG